MRTCRTSVVSQGPDRRLVFSINDFDETLPGPFEWDVKRLVASFAVAGRDRNFDAKQRKAINLAVTNSYREAIKSFAAMSNLDLWYSRIDVDEIAALVAHQASAKQRKRFERNLAKTHSKDSLRAFAKLTEIVDGEPKDRRATRRSSSRSRMWSPASNEPTSRNSCAESSAPTGVP